MEESVTGAKQAGSGVRMSEISVNEKGGALLGAEADPRLLAHLAGRHEPCPMCGFDLFGLRRDQCPECGGVVRIGVVAAKAKNSAFAVLMTPIVTAAVLGVAGMAFSTYVRRERDDWQVGLAVTIGAGLLAAIHSLFRTHAESLRGRGYIVSVITLWVLCAGAGGLAFFLDV